MKTLLGLLIAAVVGLLIVLLRNNGFLFATEARLADSMTARGPHGDPKSSPVVIVQVTEKDIRTWKQYPISDRKLKELLEKLLEAKPRAIGIDIYRDVTTPDIRGSSAKDDRADLIKLLRTPNVFTVYLNAAGDERVDPPAELIEKDSARLVLSRVIYDSDGRSRRYPLFGLDDTKTAGQLVPALGWRMAQRYLFSDGVKPEPFGEDAIKIGAATLGPLPAAFGPYPSRAKDDLSELQIPLGFRGPVEFERIDVEKVLHDPGVLSRFTDRLVFIGVINKSSKDIVASPLSDETPGVEIHAHAAEQIIRMARGGGTQGAWSELRENIYIFTVAFAAVGIVGLVRWYLLAPFAVLVLLAAIFITGFILFGRGVFVPIVPPMLSAGISGGVMAAVAAHHQRRDWAAVRSILGKTVSRDVAEEMWTNRVELIRNGQMIPQQMIATILFFDLRGFTGLAEKTDPQVMIGWLNELFQEAATIVEKSGGVVNKFVGDQILAMFGPPRKRFTSQHHREDATNAVHCALLLREMLVDLNARWSAMNRPRMYMRVGIHTGPLVAGSVGSQDRLEYTVIGTTVNIASRLESVAKELFDDTIAPGGCRILISHATFEMNDAKIRTQEVPLGELPGLSGKVIAHGVLGRA